MTDSHKTSTQDKMIGRHRLAAIVEKMEDRFFEAEFKGYDPYDGLNTFRFPGTLLKNNKISRLILIHSMKRSIWNMRPVLGVQPDVNAKSLALILSGMVRMDRLEVHPGFADQVIYALDSLRSSQSKNAAWGYYFNWQSRVFYIPANTPSAVVTSFVCQALLDLFRKTGEAELLERVYSSIQFFLDDLYLHETENGICFSYTPVDTSVIYNASALALEVIARYLHLSGKSDARLENLLDRGVQFIKAAINPDGSWYYGGQVIQKFVDHYHTAYLLESLENIRKYSPDLPDLMPTIQKGLDFYLTQMFDDNGAPRFYKSGRYPIESHCAGAAIKALCVLSEHHGQHLYRQAETVAEFAVENLYDPQKNYFYYQKKKYWTNKVNYLRWSQAWMYAGLAYLDFYGKKYGNSLD